MTLEDVESIEEIRKLKARYCRYFDTKQWPDFFDLFTEDAIFDMRSAASVEAGAGIDEEAEVGVDDLQGYQSGRDNIATYLAGIVENISSVHHVHAPEIELTSADTATGIWALDDWHQFSSGPIKTLHGFGHYHDIYVRQDGNWRIKAVRLTRLRVDIEMND